MIGLGTIINVAAIVAGGFIGLLFGKNLPDRFKNTVISGVGVSVMFLGFAGVMEKMLIIEDGGLSSSGSLMLILSLAIGAVIGELINLDSATERFGEFLKEKSGNSKNAGFVDGFVTTSFTVCIGAMAIVGAIQDGLYKDPSTLIAKSVLDFIIVIIMTASMGIGSMFSAVPVFILQGSFTLLAKIIEPLLMVNEAALSNLSMVGSALIFCVGLNLLWPGKVKVANLLPAIFVAVAYAFIE